jgi:hypothetical protein
MWLVQMPRFGIKHQAVVQAPPDSFTGSSIIINRRGKNYHANTGKGFSPFSRLPFRAAKHKASSLTGQRWYIRPPF